ncbi:MAG TPA: hypothetical protein VNQ55_02560 [Parapedobacter sp.]|nr:hypothetical protein [Parapedobacter sp.]
MIPSIRSAFNTRFSAARYQGLLASLDKPHPGALGFRVAETPVFVPRILTERLVEACEGIVDELIAPDFSPLSDRAIPPQLRVPGQENHCEVFCLDFAVCLDDAGHPTPQLIELQGFPTVLFFQAVLARAYRQCYDIPAGFDNYFNGYDDERYTRLMQRLLLGSHAPEHVVLLEVTPWEQKTRLDFHLRRTRPAYVPSVFRSSSWREIRTIISATDSRHP